MLQLAPSVLSGLSTKPKETQLRDFGEAVKKVTVHTYIVQAQQRVWYVHTYIKTFSLKDNN